MNRLNTQEEKIALVTGSARRIGAAVIKRLHCAGYKVVIHCHHSLQEAHALALSLNEQRHNSALVFQKDLVSQASVTEILYFVENWGGRLDLLVNNASLFIKTDLSEFSITDWDSLFNIHVKIPFLLSLAARSLLKQQKGAIINITDTHTDKPLKGYSVYCQSKSALEMQTKSLAVELAPEIRVNAVAPGAIIWPEGANSLSSEQKKQIIDKTWVKKHGNPEYIAHAVLALAENPFITGQILKVDGGR